MLPGSVVFMEMAFPWSAILRFAKILLKTYVLVGRQEDVEAVLFSDGQQRAITEPVPSLLRCCADLMTNQEATDRNGCALIKKNAHLRSVGRVCLRAIRGEFGCCFDFLAVKTVEPLHDVIDIGASG